MCACLWMRVRGFDGFVCEADLSGVGLLKLGNVELFLLQHCLEGTLWLLCQTGINSLGKGDMVAIRVGDHHGFYFFG
jgi:hypothetical protein